MLPFPLTMMLSPLKLEIKTDPDGSVSLLAWHQPSDQIAAGASLPPNYFEISKVFYIWLKLLLFIPLLAFDAETDILLTQLPAAVSHLHL
jgi:hypothetical protein